MIRSLLHKMGSIFSLEKRLLIFLILFLGSVAGKATDRIPVFANPTAQETDYFRFIEKTGEFISASTYELENIVPVQEKEELDRLFSNAQRAIADQSESLAKDYLEKIILRQHHYDWSETERQIFFQSFLLMTYLDKANATAYLRAAFDFDPQGIKWVEGSRIKDNFFNLPAGVIESYKAYAKTEASWQHPSPNFFAQFKGYHILRNGKWLSAEVLSKEGFPKRVARWTLLSPKFPPQTLIADVTGLYLWKPQLKTYLDGTCARPRLNENLKNLPKTVALFYDKDCVLLNSEGRWRTYKSFADVVELEAEKPNLKNYLPVYASKFTSKGQEPSTPLLPLAQTSKSSLDSRPPWLWIGVGTVAVGALIYHLLQSQNQPSQSPPSSTEIVQVPVD